MKKPKGHDVEYNAVTRESWTVELREEEKRGNALLYEVLALSLVPVGVQFAW